MRTLTAVTLLSTALATVAGCGDDGEGAADPSDPGAARATVEIETFSFAPDPLTVAPGTTVTFVNRDAIDHTVTAGTREAPSPELFDGVLPEQGSELEIVFDEAGEFEYFCEIHPGPGMTATITVRPAETG